MNAGYLSFHNSLKLFLLFHIKSANGTLCRVHIRSHVERDSAAFGNDFLEPFLPLFGGIADIRFPHVEPNR